MMTWPANRAAEALDALGAKERIATASWRHFHSRGG